MPSKIKDVQVGMTIRLVGETWSLLESGLEAGQCYTVIRLVEFCDEMLPVFDYNGAELIIDDDDWSFEIISGEPECRTTFGRTTQE